MKTSFQKITREANFLSLAGNLTAALFGFASFALMARTFPLPVFGEWVLYVSSATFIEMFRFGVTNTALVRYASGVDQDQRLKFIGSNGLIGLIITVGLAMILWFCHIAFPVPIRQAGYELFFTWYPVLGFINLAFNTALVNLQAELGFNRILLIRMLNSGGFFLVVLLNFLFLKGELKMIILGQIGVNGLTSVLCMIKDWDGLLHIRKASRKTIKTLLDFGKYTTFSLMGTQLLRSIDTLIISLSPLGTVAVAIYSIPLKLIELQQIPLKSFVATAFPKMSKASLQGRADEVKSIFYTYSGAMSLLFIFLSLMTFLLADLIVLVLGGSRYLGNNPVTGADTAMIMRIVSVYGILLPLHWMTGAGLDSINQPGKNFIKVLCMAVLTVAGGTVAVFVFRSLVMVALASILSTLLGIWVGYRFLNSKMDLDFRKIFTSGFAFYLGILRKC